MMTHSSLAPRAAVIVFLFPLSISQARADLVTWDGSCGNVDWAACCSFDQDFSETNWDRGLVSAQLCSTGLPAAGDDVVIGDNNVALACCTPVTVNSLSTRGEFEINLNTLDVADTAVFDGPFRVRFARLRTGTFISRDDLLLDSDSGPLPIELSAGARLQIEGSATMSANGEIRMIDSSSIDVEAGANLDLSSAIRLTGSAAASFNVYGRLTSSGIGTPTMISIPCSGSTPQACGFNNHGVVEILQGTLQMNSNGHHTGEFIIHSGAQLQLGAADIHQFLGDGTRFIGEGSVTGSASFLVVAPNEHASMERFSGVGFRLAGGGELIIYDALTASSIIEVNNAKLVIDANATGSASMLRMIAGGRTELRGALQVQGQILINHGSAMSQFEVAPEGVLELPSSSLVTGGGFLNPEFIVNGVMRSSSPGSSTINAIIENNGRVEVTAGRLTLARGGWTSGSFVISPGAELQFQGANLLQTFEDGSSISGGGLLRQAVFKVTDPGAVVRVEDVTLSSAMISNQGQIDFAGNCSLSQIATLNGDGLFQMMPGAELSATNLLQILGPRFENHGRISTSQTGNISIRSGAQVTNAPDGILDLRASVSVADAQSQFVNEGLVRVSAPQVVSFLGAVRNVGTIEILTGLLTLQSNVLQEPSGSIVLNGGSLYGGSSPVVSLSNGRLGGYGIVYAQTFINQGAVVDPDGGFKFLNGQSGNYVQGPGGTLAIDVNGAKPQAEYDVVKVNGLATFAGTLRLIRSSGYVPERGQTFTIIECGGRIGEFNHVELVGFPKGTRAGVKYFPNSVVVAFSFPGL